MGCWLEGSIFSREIPAGLSHARAPHCGACDSQVSNRVFLTLSLAFPDLPSDQALGLVPLQLLPCSGQSLPRGPKFAPSPVALKDQLKIPWMYCVFPLLCLWRGNQWPCMLAEGHPVFQDPLLATLHLASASSLLEWRGVPALPPPHPRTPRFQRLLLGNTSPEALVYTACLAIANRIREACSSPGNNREPT